MLKFERILCPVDFSDFSAKAYDYAQSLAKHYSAKLYLEHVVQPLGPTYPYFAFPDSWEKVYWEIDSSADDQLRQMVKARTWDGVDATYLVQRGFPEDAILEFAKKNEVDLIVMGTHGRRGLDRLTMGSITEKVLRKSSCPVLAVRKPAHDFFVAEAGQDPIRLRKILVCTDFSKHSERATYYAFSLGAEYGSEVTLVHVLEGLPTASDISTATAEITRRLENYVPREAFDWCSPKIVVRVGHAWQEIVQLALESQTDLIVIGVHGRNALGIALFGSTTHRVIQLGSCPVLAVQI
jgi:nucleotide-binding universal stress UspA family protein